MGHWLWSITRLLFLHVKLMHLGRNFIFIEFYQHLFKFCTSFYAKGKQMNKLLRNDVKFFEITIKSLPVNTWS